MLFFIKIPLFNFNKCQLLFLKFRLEGDNDINPSMVKTRRLEASIVHEARTLYIVAIGVLLFMVHPVAGQTVGVLGFLLVVVMDTYFSITITALFLRPITKVLNEGRGVAEGAQGYKSMQKTKWMTLCGSVLAVLSSTVMYIFFVVFLASI